MYVCMVGGSKHFFLMLKGFERTVMMTGLEHLKNCSSSGVFPILSGQYLLKVVQERSSGKLATGPWAAKAQRLI